MEYSKAEIVGHELQRRFLLALGRSGRIPKALLFSGPDSVGKRLVAKEWISSFFDDKEKALVRSGAHPDVFFLEKAGQEITVEEVRAIQEFVSRKAISGRKFVLIDDAHRMNEVAANAFLKTLEEPGKSTCFVLITSQKERLLSTIRSRCIELRFSALSSDELSRIVRENDKLYEGTVAPILEESVKELGALYGRFLNQIKGRPFVLKDRGNLIRGFRAIAVFLHDLLANEIAPELAYNVISNRVGKIENWIRACERLFELVGVAEMANLASVEADLAYKVRLSA